MTLPTVHLNGTSRDVLVEQRTEVGQALNAALDALVGASPHGRDYYPQGDNALAKAQKEWQERATMLRNMRDDIMAEALTILDGE